MHEFSLITDLMRKIHAIGVLEQNCQHRPVQYLNNVLEQDHRRIKRRVRASQHFRSFWGVWRTIAGYEAIRLILIQSDLAF